MTVFIFLPGMSGGPKYLYRPDSQFKQLDWNLRLLINVMPQIQKSGIPFIFSSSQLAEEYMIQCTDRPKDWVKYGHTCWEVSGYVYFLWNIYGPLENPSERTHVISDFIYQAVNKNKIEMMTTGEEVRQFIYIDDVCEALHMALDKHLTDIYDITSFEWISVMDVAKIISKLTGCEIIPGRKGGSTPITPIRGKVPNWMPKVDIETGIKNMLDNFKGIKLND